jgi:hypothetical protein
VGTAVPAESVALLILVPEGRVGPGRYRFGWLAGSRGLAKASVARHAVRESLLQRS